MSNNECRTPKETSEVIKLDAFVRSRKRPFSVIPAKAGIQEQQALLDPGFRRGDGFDCFLGRGDYSHE
jgi:hypothetical protein